MTLYKKLLAQTKNLSLLLVEDYQPLQQDMKEILDDFFKRVIIASNGSEALTLYKTYKEEHQCYIDLVLSDIEMPVMDGVALTKALYTINKSQKIVILSAYTDETYLLPLINLGIEGFLKKPIEYEALMETLLEASKGFDTVEEIDNTIVILDAGQNYVWDKRSNALKHEASLIELTRNELILMRYMVQKMEQICTTQEILEHFYEHGVDISEKSIRNLIFKLRKKLPTECIRSSYGMGYRLTAIV
ncbi:MAG: response regulator transcription factor [Campylobacterota bacterium]|nr:response regulator transcription factor [Campylobacterota bacterium]